MNWIGAWLHPLRYMKERLHLEYYEHVHVLEGSKNQPRWRGIKVVKYPGDMFLYAQVLFDKKPDYIIETGTFQGGSALFFADIMSIYGGKQVISIDVVPATEQMPRGSVFPEHPKLTCVACSSTSPLLVDRLTHDCMGMGTVMVILDSSHSRWHVDRELELYAPLVSPGQYLVVEDCYSTNTKPDSPYYSVQDFLGKNEKFTRHPLEEQFIFAVTRGGWLYRNP